MPSPSATTAGSACPASSVRRKWLSIIHPLRHRRSAVRSAKARSCMLARARSRQPRSKTSDRHPTAPTIVEAALAEFRGALQAEVRAAILALIEDGEIRVGPSWRLSVVRDVLKTSRKRAPCSAQLHDRSVCGDRAVGMMVLRDHRFRHEYPRCRAHLASIGSYDILPFDDG